MIYTRSSGLILRLAIYHLPGNTIRTYRAPVIKFYFYLRCRTSLKDCQLVVYIVCVLFLPINLSLRKKTSVRWCPLYHRAVNPKQLLGRFLLLTTVLINSGGWHQFRRCCLLDECYLLLGCCWMNGICCWAVAGWMLVAAGLLLDEC